MKIPMSGQGAAIGPNMTRRRFRRPPCPLTGDGPGAPEAGICLVVRFLGCDIILVAPFFDRRTSQMHAHRAARVPFALHEEGGGKVWPSAAGKHTGNSTMQVNSVTMKVLVAGLTRPNPSYEV